MKIYKLLLIIAMGLMTTGCQEYGEKRIVKLVTVNNREISLYYYDYTSDKPEYIVETMENTGIHNTLTQMLSENSYDLKLCRYVVCENDILKNNVQELVNGLIGSKFSMDTVIVQGDTGAEAEKYINIKNDDYPIYSYYMENGVINGVVEIPDAQSKNIIIQGRLYSVLSPQSSFAFDIIKNNLSKGTYIFSNNAVLLTADLENITLFYSVKDGTGYITVNALLKNYKGMPATPKDKLVFTSFMEKSLKNDIEKLLNDTYMTQSLRLDWFKNHSICNDTEVVVDIR